MLTKLRKFLKNSVVASLMAGASMIPYHANALTWSDVTTLGSTIQTDLAGYGVAITLFCGLALGLFLLRERFGLGLAVICGTVGVAMLFAAV